MFDTIPSLKQTGGSVVSSNPEQIAFMTPPLSSFPEIVGNTNKIQGMTKPYFDGS
jgi:hypothetical protein